MPQPKIHVNPFPHKKSIAHLAFGMALRGMAVSRIKAFVSSRGGDPVRVIRILRLGEWNGVKWKLVEENNYLKVELQNGNRVKRNKL
jgi:hypothetical protein